MKKGTIISIIALLVSIVGLLIALIAYFKRRNCVLCDDLDDDLVEYYDEDEDCGCCDCRGAEGEDAAPEAEAAPAEEAKSDDEISF